MNDLANALPFSYVDLIVILILVFTTYYGKQRGLLISAYNFCSYFLTFILTKMFHEPFAKYLLTTDVYKKVYERVYDKLDYKDVINDQVYSSSADALSALGLPDFMITFLENNVEFDAYQTFNLDAYRELVTVALTDSIISILAFVSVFIFVIVAIKVVGMVLQIIKNLPVISQLDHMGGGVFGFLNGVVFIFIAFLLISLMFIYSLPENAANAFNNSFFYNMFTNLGFFENLFFGTKG